MTTAPFFVILVTFELVRGSRNMFLPLMIDNARRSVDLESGCSRFDVLEVMDSPDTILLYEIYDDRQAFDFHLTAPHFLEFDAATRHMIARKDVVACQLTEPAIKGTLPYRR